MVKSWNRIGVLFLGAVVAICPALTAAQHGHGNPHGNPHAKKGGVEIRFSLHDQEIIRNYFTDTSNLPPGLAKRGGNLPPGLEKHLERDGQLPPGLQKRLQPFPESLERRLPPLPEGCSRVILGDRALILDATRTILDIIYLARR